MGSSASAGGAEEDRVAREFYHREWARVEAGATTIDALVHQSVFGGVGKELPYSSDISAAWRVVRHFTEGGISSLRSWGMLGRVFAVEVVDGEWSAQIREVHWDAPYGDHEREPDLDAEVRELGSATKAICWVALVALAVAAYQEAQHAALPTWH